MNTMGNYQFHSKITGLAGPTLCMTATEDGKLACGGRDGTRIWCIPGLEVVERPCGAGRRSATTAVTWIRREDAPEDVLVYGTQAGYLVVWKENRSVVEKFCLEEVFCAQLMHPAEVTGLCFEPTSNRLAVCTRSSVVLLFAVGLNMKLTNIFTVTIPNHIPKSVAFERVGHSHSVLSFGLYDGRIHALRADTGEVENTIETGGMIGNAQLDSKRNILCIDDPSEGAMLYHLDNRTRVKNYPVPVRKSMRPRQVAFAEDCTRIIVGSDHGKVYVFDRWGGEIIEQLKMSSRVWVQTILAVDIYGVSYIIAGKSQEDEQGGEVVIWERTSRPQAVLEMPHLQKQQQLWILHFVLSITFIAFIYQNLWVLEFA